MSPSRLVICAFFFFEYSVLLQPTGRALWGLSFVVVGLHSADLAQEAVHTATLSTATPCRLLLVSGLAHIPACNTLSFPFLGLSIRSCTAVPLSVYSLDSNHPSSTPSFRHLLKRLSIAKKNQSQLRRQPASRQLACSAAHSGFFVWLSSLSFFILSFLRHLSSHRFRFLTKHRNAVLCFPLSFTPTDTVFNKHPPNYFSRTASRSSNSIIHNRHLAVFKPEQQLGELGELPPPRAILLQHTRYLIHHASLVIPFGWFATVSFLCLRCPQCRCR